MAGTSSRISARRRVGGPVAVALAGALLLAGIGPASAGNPALLLHAKMVFDFETSTSTGTFVATGDAVNDDAFCHKGSGFQHFTVVGADELGPNHVQGTDVYDCDDGSGSITIEFDAVRTKAGRASNQFDLVGCIVAGTGDYVSLRGVSGGSAQPNFANNKLTLKYDFAELDDTDCPIA